MSNVGIDFNHDKSVHGDLEEQRGQSLPQTGRFKMPDHQLQSLLIAPGVHLKGVDDTNKLALAHTLLAIECYGIVLL